MSRPRALLISHTYVVTANRAKLVAMAARNEFDLDVVVPPYWADMIRETRTATTTDTAYTLHVLPAYQVNNGLRFFFNPLALWQLLRTLQPTLVYIEEEPWSVSALETLLLSRLCGIKRFGFFTWENLDRSHRFPGNLIENGILAQATFAVAGNEGAAAVLRRKGFGKPLKVIPQLGLDAEANQYRPEPELRADIGLSAPIVGFAGRFIEEKGILVLLEAVEGLLSRESFSLLVIGAGPLKTAVAQRLSTPPWAGRAHLLDSVPHAEVIRYINCMDVVVSASYDTPTWVEQYGLIVLSAMGCERAVIGTDCGETPHLIGDAGWVCRQNDVTDLRAKIQLALSDAPARAQFGARARARVLARNTNAAIAAALNQFLLEQIQ